MRAIVTVNTVPVSFSDTLPGFLANELLYNSRCFYMSGQYGYILAQSLDANPYSMLYAIAAIQQDADVSLSSCDIGFACHFTLDKSVPVHSPQTGFTLLHAQSVMLLFSPAWVVTASLKENENYKSLTLLFPASVVLERLRMFPLLDSLEVGIKKSKPLYMADAIYPLSVHLTEMLSLLLQVPYTFLSKQYYHSLLLSVLSEVFAHMQSGSSRQTSFALTDIAAVSAAKQWIDAHLNTHFTIGQIARKVALNEFKLKKGFREMYGIGLYGYLLQQRLAIAKVNLEQTTKSIMQIARQAGYKNTANFSAAFKRQFGTTPHRFRQQNGPQ